MSYCRWSSMDWRCDLYCYEDASGGWTTHVAASRRKEPPPPARPFDRAHLDRWLEDHQMQMKWLEEHPELVPIGGRYDGMSFSDATLEQFLQRLTVLRSAGYVFPDHVLDDVRDEIKTKDRK